MAREPDRQSPAMLLPAEEGDCLSDVPPDLLEDVMSYHYGAEPPDTDEPADPIPEAP